MYICNDCTILIWLLQYHQMTNYCESGFRPQLSQLQPRAWLIPKAVEVVTCQFGHNKIGQNENKSSWGETNFSAHLVQIFKEEKMTKLKVMNQRN